MLAATATVTIELNMLDSVTHTVAKEAFVDDRTLDCHDCGGLKRAVEAIVEMDGRMGHSTNVDKSKFLATSRNTRKTMGKMKIGGIKLCIVDDNKPLGHRCIRGARYVKVD